MSTEKRPGKIGAVLGILALAMPPAISAPTKPWHYAVLAYGNDSCLVWTSNHSRLGRPKEWEDAWIWGYVTAVNRWGTGSQDIAKTQNWDAIARWVDRYCATHPDEKIAEAAIKLVVTLQIGGGLPPHHR